MYSKGSQESPPTPFLAPTAGSISTVFQVSIWFFHLPSRSPLSWSQVRYFDSQGFTFETSFRWAPAQSGVTIPANSRNGPKALLRRECNALLIGQSFGCWKSEGISEGDVTPKIELQNAEIRGDASGKLAFFGTRMPQIQCHGPRPRNATAAKHRMRICE